MLTYRLFPKVCGRWWIWPKAAKYEQNEEGYSRTVVARVARAWSLSSSHVPECEDAGDGSAVVSKFYELECDDGAALANFKEPFG